jgi:Tol biopolymer transport system component
MNFSRICYVTALSILFVCLSAPNPASAVEQIETQYYTIIYDEDSEYTAGVISTFCDEVYEQISARYQAFSDDPRVLCIVNDAVDMANGYAVHYQNTITIYSTNMDFELRGQSNWLRNVFVHEMTHLISLKKAAKGPINYISLGGGQYNENPDVNVDILLHHLSLPAWFYEGSAQLGAEMFGTETWDSHRDMLLRSAWIEDSLLSLDEMSVLPGKKAVDAELVYNQGYSLVRFIKEKYGYEKIVELNNSCGYYDFNPTIKDVLGISAGKLYDEWRAHLDTRYARFRDKNFVHGEKVDDGTFPLWDTIRYAVSEEDGSLSYFPVMSPDGRYTAWLSNMGRDYSITDLVLKDMSSGESRVIVKNVDYRVSWSHDSKTLVYVRRPDRSPRFYDIYTYDIGSETETRLSKNMRARYPGFSPDGSRIVFVKNYGGNNALAVIDPDGSDLRLLTASHDGTQFYSPSYSPDGSRIVFGLFGQNHDRDIGIINAKTDTYRYDWDLADSTAGFSDSTSFAVNSDFELLVATKFDERDPGFMPDGSGIYFSSDMTGTFNIYALDFKTNRTSRLTDVSGGAFSPSAVKGGGVYYSGYTARDFSIYRIDSDASVERSQNYVELRDYITQPEQFDISDNFHVEPYRRKRIVNAVVPTLSVGPSFIGSQFGLNVVDAGASVYLSDVLGYDSLVFGGSVGKNLKEDVALNSSFEVLYERSMVPVTSSNYSHSPRFFAGASRTVINNYINRLNAVADSAYYADRPDIGYGNVLHDLHQTLVVNDEYRDEFRRYRIGILFPLANRHSLRFEAGIRQYYESMKRYNTIKDFSNYFSGGIDITGEVPFAGSSESYDTRFFTDLNYFKSREFDISYVYQRTEPAADNFSAPKGTALMLQFRHMKSSVADSLIDQPQYFAPLGINPDGSIAVGEYHPDPMLDEYRTFKIDQDINEYLLILRHNRKLPFWRHTLNGVIFTAYKDVALKDVRNDEGSGFNWPLKYYVGGANLMSGYPYFAFWGSKLFYSRLGYTFPIKRRIAKDLFGFNFQSLYANAFMEAAKTWNFEKLSMANLEDGEFKRDVGIELRLNTMTFYRFSTLLYARVAWPLDDMSGSYYENDARRFYFGLRM